MEVNELYSGIANNAQKWVHLSFKECFSCDWRIYFQEKDTLLTIMTAAGLTNTHDFVQVNSRYLIDDNRIAIIIMLKRRGTEILDKLIIDTISGQPSFEQFKDVFYNIGADFDYRIILYDENTREYTEGLPIIDVWISQLMDHFRGSAFFSVMGIDLGRTEGKAVTFHRANVKTISKDNKDSKLPDRRDIDVIEFWDAYLPHRWANGFDGWEQNLFNGDEYYEDGPVPIEKAKWNEDGIIYEIRIENDYFAWLSKEKSSLMNDYLAHCSFNYNPESCILTIKKDIPFRNFTYLLPEDKENIAWQFLIYSHFAHDLGKMIEQWQYAKWKSEQKDNSYKPTRKQWHS